MSAFHFIKGHYLLLFLVAVILHLLMALFAPDPNGYVWDFYSDAIIFAYENGQLPEAKDCWVCYHPPLLPLIGSGVFHLAALFSSSQDLQLFMVAFLLNAMSLIFAVYSFAVYLQFRKYPQLDLILWALILFLPVRFISSFSIESDMLAATFIVISLYYFILFIRQQNTPSLCLCAIFVALAALTKYTGVVIAVFYGMVLLIRFLKTPEPMRFKQGLIYAAIACLLGGYPYVNNFIDSGTPIVGNKAWNKNKGYYNYNFRDFSIPRIVGVFNDDRQAKLKHFYPFNSEVLNSLYGQIWTDFTFFSKAYRHGQYEKKYIYKGKYMPTVLLWAILISGLVPVICGIGGFALLFFQRENYLLITLTLLCLGLYMHWFMGHNFWMLKTKYLLHLIPVAIISISQAARVINPVILRILLIPCVFFSMLYCFFFAVF